MRGCWLSAVVGWGLVVGGAVARGADGVPMADINSCVSRLDPQLDIGYDRIAAKCPDLMRQLDQGGWAPWLPKGWKESGNDLSAGGLRQLSLVVDRELRASEASAGPDVRQLRPVLTELTGTRDQSGWSRFKSWLRSILERPEQPAEEGWITRMVSQMGTSQLVIRVVTIVSLSAVILLAGFIVFNELRAAGLIRRRAAAGRKAGEVASGDTERKLQDIEQAPLADRPRLLLELIVRRLSERGWLPPAGALTVRELTQVARLSEPDDRARLVDVALAAERVRYSAEGVGATLAEPIGRGRELLSRLEREAE